MATNPLVVCMLQPDWVLLTEVTEPKSELRFVARHLTFIKMQKNNTHFRTFIIEYLLVAKLRNFQ